jgi:hypothetical protein
MAMLVEKEKKLLKYKKNERSSPKLFMVLG